MDLAGKCVLLGVCGGIAAYKIWPMWPAHCANWGTDVEVIMTKTPRSSLPRLPLRPLPATNAWWTRPGFQV